MSNAQDLETYGVVRNILDLMANDVIWPDAIVRFNSGSVEVRPWRTWTLTEKDLADTAGRIARIEEEFPGGNHRVIGGRASGGQRRRPFFDSGEYRVRVLNVAVEFAYPTAHTHSGYYGQAGKEGKPEWRCIGCRQRITITEARKLGLLPPLVRKPALP
jgi:hypothetical protein